MSTTITDIRELTGMNYKSIEFDHHVSTPIEEVLRSLADWLSDNTDGGLLVSIYTGLHPESDERFLTQLVWSE